MAARLTLVPGSALAFGDMAPVSTAEEAPRIAQETCSRLALPWSNPVVKRRWRSWLVFISGNQRGGNTMVRVRRMGGSARVRSYDR